MRVSAVTTDSGCRAPGRSRGRAPFFPAEKSRGLRGNGKLTPCKRRNAQPGLLGANRGPGEQLGGDQPLNSMMHPCDLEGHMAMDFGFGNNGSGAAGFPSMSGYFEKQNAWASRGMHSATRDGLSELQRHPAVALVPLRRVWLGIMGALSVCGRAAARGQFLCRTWRC